LNIFVALIAFFRARGKNYVLHSSSSSFVERDYGGMSKDPVGDMWDAPELSQSGKHLYPLQESGQGRMVIAYAFTLLSCYFHPFSSSCVTLSKFRLLFPFGVYPLFLLFLFCSCEGWSLFLIFPFVFKLVS